MNKELYIKREKQLEELRKLSSIVNNLKLFLEETENKFQIEESIKAINNIKLYYEIKEKEYNESKIKEKQIYQELYSICKHEIAIKYSNIPCYKCLICDCILEPENSLIAIDTTKDYNVAYIIEDIFKEILYSDKDLIETINEIIEEIQYDRDIKVYRRQR